MADSQWVNDSSAAFARGGIPADVRSVKLLSNGLRIVVWPLKSVSRVQVQCSYFGVGSQLETAQKNRGGAHFLEHMIFKGTKRQTHVDAQRVQKAQNEAQMLWPPKQKQPAATSSAPPPTTASAAVHRDVQKLLALGFSKENAEAALAANDGDVEKSIAQLLLAGPDKGALPPARIVAPPPTPPTPPTPPQPQPQHQRLYPSLGRATVVPPPPAPITERKALLAALTDRYLTGSDATMAGSSSSAMRELVASGAGLGLDEGDIDWITQYYSACNNAFTCVDTTSYFFNAPAGNFEAFLCILADSMEHLHVDDDKVASECKAVLEELNAGLDNPCRVGIAACNELLFAPGEPGHESTIGDEKQLMRQQGKILQDFYDAHYHPWSPTTVSIVGHFGGISTEEVLRCAAYIFGGVRVRAYKAHQEVAAVCAHVKRDTDAASVLMNRAHEAVNQLDPKNAFTRVLHDRLRRRVRAIEVGATKSYDDMVPVLPLPSTAHRTVFLNTAAATEVFGFRIPGCDDEDAPSGADWSYVSYLLSGVACARLPPSFSAESECRRCNGAFYVVAQQFSGAIEPFQAVKCALEQPVTIHEADRVRKALYAKYIETCEDASAFSSMLVHTLATGELPRPPPRTARAMKERLQRALSLLRMENVQWVTVAPAPQGSGAAKAIARRNKHRNTNTAILGEVMIRPHAGSRRSKKTATMGEAHPMPNVLNELRGIGGFPKRVEAKLDVPSRMVAASAAEGAPVAARAILFEHPSTQMVFFARVPAKERVHTLARIASNVAAATLHFGPGKKVLERRGCAFSISDDGASIMQPYGPEAASNIAALLRRARGSLDKAAFEKERRREADKLRRAARNPVTATLWEMERLFSNDPEKIDYSLEEAAQWVCETMTRKYAAKMLQKQLFGGGSYAILIRPSSNA